MFSIAIYTESPEIVAELKGIIQDFLIEYKAIAKVSFFNDTEKLEVAPQSYDIYIMDMDSKGNVMETGAKLISIDKGSKFLYIANDINKAYEATTIFADYFLPKPIPVDGLKKILSKVLKSIRGNSLVIQTAAGERRVRLNIINYVNIVKRCLCYHLNDGSMFDGQTLRVAFEKAMAQLINHESFVFIDPSLLINLSEIKILEKDHAIFENGDVVYFPKKAYDLVRERWVNYSKIIE